MASSMLEQADALLYPPYKGGGGYYDLVIVTPRPQTLHCSHDNLENPYQIASIYRLILI